jgi:hypothetical protein
MVGTCALCGGVGNPAVCWTAGCLLRAGAVESDTNCWSESCSCHALRLFLNQHWLLRACMPDVCPANHVVWLSTFTASSAGISSCYSTQAAAWCKSCMMLCMHCMAFEVAVGLSQPVVLNSLLHTVS